MVFIKVTERYAITSDELCWKLQKKTKRGFESFRYYGDLESLAKDLIWMLVRRSDASDIPELILEIKRASTVVSCALPDIVRVGVEDE